MRSFRGFWEVWGRLRVINHELMSADGKVRIVYDGTYSPLRDPGYPMYGGNK